MRTFGKFECDLDRMMRQVDLFASERKRLTALLCRIMREQGMAPVSDNGHSVTSDDTGGSSTTGCDDQTRHIDAVKVMYKVDCVEYSTCLGQTRMKIGFDARKRDVMLRYEHDAHQKIADRLTKDRQQRSAYRRRLTAASAPYS